MGLLCYWRFGVGSGPGKTAFGAVVLEGAGRSARAGQASLFAKQKLEGVASGPPARSKKSPVKLENLETNLGNLK
jgi:hypothetical protein